MTAAGDSGGFDFDAATRLAPGSAAGTFEIQISDQWSGLASVNGGFLLATCLKALATAVPFPDPVTVSGLYLRPGNPGPSVVRTELIRAGRTTGFGEAHLLQSGKEVLRVTAAFADLSQAPPGPGLAPRYAGATPPKLPAPEDCLRLSGISAISMAKRFEFRAPAVPGWITGKPSGDPFAEFWMRFADGRPADTMTLPLIVDAAPPAVLELGLSSTTIELTVHVRARPAPGWLACRTSTRFVSGGYHEEDFEVWDCAGVLVAQSRQLALVRPFGSLPPRAAGARAQLEHRGALRDCPVPQPGRVVGAEAQVQDGAGHREEGDDQCPDAVGQATRSARLEQQAQAGDLEQDLQANQQQNDRAQHHYRQ